MRRSATLTRLAIAAVLALAVVAGSGQPSAARSHGCQGARLTVRRHRRRRSVRCLRLPIAKLLGGSDRAGIVSTSLSALAAALPKHGPVGRIRKVIAGLSKSEHGRAAGAGAASLHGGQAATSAGIAGVGQTTTTVVNGKEDGGTVKGTKTELDPDASHLGGGEVADESIEAMGAHVHSHGEEAAFLPRCPGKNGKSSGPLVYEARTVVKSGDRIFQSSLEFHGTLTVQFDGEGNFQSTTFEGSFKSALTTRGGEDSTRIVDGHYEQQVNADKTVTGRGAEAETRGAVSEGYPAVVVGQLIGGIGDAAKAAIADAIKAAKGERFDLTFEGHGAFDLTNSAGGVSTAHDDLAWAAVYPFERTGGRLEPENPGRLDAGPGTFRFERPENNVSCSGPLAIAEGAHPPEILPGGGTRFELRPVFALAGEGAPVFRACQGEVSGLPFDASGEAADQAAEVLNQYLPYVLETRVEIPQEALERGVFTGQVSDADAEAQLPSSCDEFFGTEPGKCTMSLHYTGTVTLAPSPCVASKATARMQATAEHRRYARAR